MSWVYLFIIFTIKSLIKWQRWCSELVRNHIDFSCFHQGLMMGQQDNCIFFFFFTLELSMERQRNNK